jgi:hypothetical protein
MFTNSWQYSVFQINGFWGNLDACDRYYFTAYHTALLVRKRDWKWLGVKTKTKLNSVALVRERTIPTERPPLVGELVPSFADRGCRVVSAADSQGR